MNLKKVKEESRKNRLYLKQNGITLTTLVVTIVVLLILAGVSINIVVKNDGILGQTRKAQKVNTISTAKEAAELLVFEHKMEFYSKNDFTKSATDYIKKQNIKKDLGNYYVSISRTGDVNVYEVNEQRKLVARGDLNEKAEIVWDENYEAGIIAGIDNTYELKKILYSYSANSDGNIEVSFNFAISNIISEEDYDNMENNLEQVIIEYLKNNIYQDLTDDKIEKYAESNPDNLSSMFKMIYIDYLSNKYISPLQGLNSMGYSEMVDLFVKIMKYKGEDITTEEAKQELSEISSDFYNQISSIGTIKDGINEERFARDVVAFYMYQGLSDEEFVKQFSRAKVNVKLPNAEEKIVDAFGGFEYTIPQIFNGITLNYRFKCVDWTGKELTITITNNNGVLTKKMEQGELVRTETKENLKLCIDYESAYNGLDECYIKVTPSQYYQKPTRVSDLTQYLTEDEKWNIAINLYSQVYEKKITEEELREIGLKQFGTDDIDALFSLLDGYGITVEHIMTDEYLESFDKNTNNVYKGINISINDGDAIEEWKTDYGCASYSVKKNKQYTITATYNGTVIAKETIDVKNILEWSEPYTTTETYIDSEGNKAIIPKGFRVATTQGYNLVTQGLLVKDSYDNTFVWIPCTTLPKAESRGAGEIVDITDIETSEYLKMKSSVEKNSGFYVGRYETSLKNNKAASIRSYKDNLVRGGTYEEQYALLTSLYSNNSPVLSTMMWGGNYAVLYDLTTIFKNNDRGISASGFYPENETYHIYDMYENLREISQAQTLKSEENKHIEEPWYILYGACSGPWLTEAPSDQIRYTDSDLNNSSKCLGSRILLYINN